jgi:hypothetical protein
MLRYESDVIVIGAGIAGVTAAIELLERGRRVLLLDRDVEQNMGALAKESFGGIWFAGTPLQKRYGIRDGAEQGLRDWHAFAEFGPEDHWPRAWAEAYVQRANEEIFDWLRGIGVQFMPMPLWVERGLHTPGNSVPRWHIVWGTGHELAVVTNRHLLSRPNRDKLELRFGHRVESLVSTNGRVTGCRGGLEGSAQEFEARAESVIIASGGINGDIARVKQHWHADWGRPPETILNGSHKYATGGCTMPPPVSAPTSRISTGSGTTRPACTTGNRASLRTDCRWCRPSRRCGSTGAASASGRCRSSPASTRTTWSRRSAASSAPIRGSCSTGALRSRNWPSQGASSTRRSARRTAWRWRATCCAATAGCTNR